MDAHERLGDARATERRLKRLVRLAPGATAGAAGSLVAGAIASVATLVALAGILDTFLTQPPAAPLALARPFTWLAALVLLRAGCAGALELCGQRLATAIKSHLRAELVAAILARGPRLTAPHPHPLRASGERDESATPAGELVADIADGVEKLDAYYRRYLPQVCAAAITPLAVLTVAFWIDPASGAILAVTAPLVLVFLWLLGTRAETLARRQWRTLRTLSGLFLDTLQGLTTTLLFGRAEEAIAWLDESGERYRAATMSVLRTAFLSGLVLDLAATLSTALVAVGVGVRLVEGWMSFGPAIAVLLLTPELYAPIRQLGQRRHAGMEGLAAAERIFVWMDGGSEAQGRKSADGATNDAPLNPCPGASLRQDAFVVRFDRVSFRYPHATRQVLSAIDFELRSRTLTAIVGPSGGGKTTLIDLLLRFAHPTEGTILANGGDIAAADAREWRRRIAFVPQRPQFLDGSVLDNLRIGRPDASLDQIRAAATRSEIDAFVMALPRGYDTSLGEMAGRASVGERQRLALARALVREAPLLVLDEPSSSLDPMTEAAIARVIVDESRQRAVVIVAHRLRTVRAAHRIIVLDAGRIVETGRHDELVQRGGVYARFVGTVEPELEAAT
jgi:thiol reductant ABC exporter CydD subunit